MLARLGLPQADAAGRAAFFGFPSPIPVLGEPFALRPRR